MKLSPEEIRVQRLARQYLLEPAPAREVVRSLCGVQAQFLSNALHALRIRCSDDSGAAAQQLVKNWTLRGTMHLFAPEDLPLFLPPGGPADYRSQDWSRPSFWNRRPDWVLTPQRQAFFSALIVDALQDGPLSRDALKVLCRAQGMTETEEANLFHAWGGGIGELCTRGFLNQVASEQKLFCLCPAFEPMPREDAMLELARRYFTHYGPASIHDAMYFFRATAAQVRSWLAQLPVTAVDCDGRTYYSLGDCAASGIPRCRFLAGFDPLMLGYEKKESPFLDPSRLRAVFSLAGIVSPTVLLDGQVCGTWKKTRQKLQIRLFPGVTARSRDDIRETAAALWPEGISVTFSELDS